MNEILQIEHYPFTSEEDARVIRLATFQQMHKLLDDEVFDDIYTNKAFSLFANYYADNESLFDEEEQARKLGIPGANLYYHGKEHAIFQATYDAIAVTRALLSRKDKFATHLTAEGAFSIPLGGLMHDIGYPAGGPYENYAARTPLHVIEGMKEADKIISKIGVPQGMDLEKVKKLVLLGIHTTNFPFTQQHAQEARELLNTMTPMQRKEAQIVRLAVQFADLGGQTARVDYYPKLIRKLREEMNEATENNGNNTIGNDDELAQKCQGFINFVVKKTVGKTGNAFFGEVSHPYFNKWIENGTK